MKKPCSGSASSSQKDVARCRPAAKMASAVTTNHYGLGGLGAQMTAAQIETW